MARWQYAHVRAQINEGFPDTFALSTRLAGDKWQPAKDNEGSLELLDQLGQKGWEVASTCTIGAPPDYQLLYTLKRPVP